MKDKLIKDIQDSKKEIMMPTDVKNYNNEVIEKSIKETEKKALSKTSEEKMKEMDPDADMD